MTDDTYDRDELDELAQEMNPDSLTPEDIFSLVTFNPHKKTKVSVVLKDENEEVVQLPEVIDGILKFISAKLKEDSNQFVEQILPLMSQSIVSGLHKMLGTNQALFMLTQDNIRDSILYMMCTAFMLLKFVQNNNLKIHTYEEKVTDEEIESTIRKSKANKIATLGAMLGEDPVELLKQMVNEGAITQEDLESMLSKTNPNKVF